MATANRTFRSSMLLSTALAAIVAMPGAAHAQLVTSGDLVDAIDSGGNPGQLTVVDTSPVRTDMTVLAPVVVANWNRFNVPVGTTVNVANGTTNATATLVNRVIGPNVSDIGGTINAADVNFWLINQNGILFGADTQINTRSFFASTLDVTDADLFDFYEGTDLAGNGSSTIRFSGPAASTSGITGGGANASFVTDGTMMFVGPALNLDATFNAQTGNVAFVAASDVTVSFTPGSPLSFVLNAGTTVAEQTIAGSVSGRAIDIQMLTASGVVGALLNVDASLNATAAAPTDSGIRLFAEQAGAASVTVEMTGGITSTGLIDLRTDGALSSTAAISGSGVQVQGNQGVTVDDVTATNGIIALRTAGNLVGGDLRATGNITFSASNTGSATLDSAVSTGGIVAVSGLIPGTITITGLTQGNTVSLTSINALNLGNVVSTAGSVSLDSFGGAVTTGNIDAATDARVTGVSIDAGDVLARSGIVRLLSRGAITANSVTALSGAIDIDSFDGGALDLGALSASGNINLDTTGSITTAAITAGGNLTVGAVGLPGSVTFTGAASASNITIDTAGAFIGTTLTATTGSVDVDAGSISSGNIVATTGNVLLDADGDITTGSVTANQFSSTAGTITIRSATGNLNLGNLVAGFDIALDTGGSITGTSASSRGGVLNIGQTTEPAGSVNFSGSLIGQSVTIDTAGAFSAGDITARIGNIDIDSLSINAGIVRAQTGNVSLVAVDDITVASAFADPQDTAGGTLTIRSTAGGDLNLGALVAGGDLTLDTAGTISGTTASSRSGALTIGQTAVPGSITFTGSLGGGSVTIDTTGAFSALDVGASTGDVDIAALSIAARDIRATVGNVLLTATNNITAGIVAADILDTASGRIAITSLAGGTLSLGALSSGGDLTLDTAGSISGTTATSRGGNLVIGGTAIPGTVTFTGALAGQSVFVDALGAFSAGGITARAGHLDIDALSITTGALSAVGGDVILTADEAITTGAITATAAGGLGGTIDVLTTGAFAISTGNLTATGDVILDGDLTIATGAIRAGGGLFVGGGSNATNVTFGGAAVASEIAVTIDGALTAGALTATNGDVFVTADSLSAGDISAAAGDVSLVTTNGITTGNILATEVGGVGGLVLVDSTGGGAIALGNVTADQNILIDTTGNITTGNLTSDRMVAVGSFRQPAAGTSTTLGNVRGERVLVETLGALQTGNVTATAGAIDLTADTIAALAVAATGGNVTLRANGDITTTAITARTALGIGGEIDVASLSGGDLDLGTLIADQSILLNTTGSVATGAVTAGQAFNVGQTAVPSSVTLGGNVTAASIFIRAAGEVLAGERDAQGNLVRVTNVTATQGGLSVQAGSITAGNLRATSGDVNLAASGAIDVDDVTATIASGNGGNIIIDSSGGALDLGDLTASLGITLDALGAIRTGAISATGGALNVGTNRVAASVTFTGAASAQSITVITPGAFEATSLTATAGNVTANVGSMRAAAIRATGGDVSLTAVNSIETTTINSTGLITVTSTGAAGNLTLGALTAGTDITLDAGGAIGTGAITSTGGFLRVGVNSDADSVTFGGDASARGIIVRTAGAFDALDLTATANVIDVDAGTIEADILRATGGSVTLVADGRISTAAITTTGSIGVTSTGTGMAAGNITLGQLSATDNVLINGNGAISTGAITAGGILQIGVFSDATSVTIGGNASARSIEVDTLGAFQAARLTATAGSVTANADAITATGAISATGGGVTLTAVRGITTAGIDADTAISVTSTGTGTSAGNLSLGALTAGADITLNGNGAIGTGTILSSGGALLVGLTSAATSVTFAGNATARRITVNSAGTIATQQLSATAGDVALTAVRGIGTGAIGATGAITATSSGTGANAGNLALGNLTAGGNITLDGNAAIDTGAINAAAGALRAGLASAATSVTFGGNATARSIGVRSTGAVTTQALTATAGDVTVNGASITSGAVGATGGNVTLTAARNVTTGAITASRVAGIGGAIRVLSTGTGANAGILNLGALLADLGIELDAGGAITTGAMTARNGAVDVEGASIAVNGAAAATGGNVRLLASGAITTGALSAAAAGNVGGAIDVDSTGGGAVNLASLNAARGITIDTTGSVTTGAVTAGNDLVIGLDRRASAITLNGTVAAANVNAISGGTVTANVVNVGTGTVRVEAADADLRGAITAATVTLKSFNNGTIGLGSATGTMRLSDTELDLINAGTLTIDAGTGNVGIAGVSFTANAGSTAVNIATTGNIAITGDITGTGANRTFRLGGPVAGSGTASRIIATVDTATINLGSARLDLRGTDIVFGKTALIQGVFGNTAVGSILTGGGSRLSIDELVRQFVANPQSALYTSDGLAADKVGKPFLIAGSMSVTYGGSALFQNTAPRTGGLAFEGVKLADATNPAVPALTLNPLTAPTAQAGGLLANGNVFSIFGTVNGAEGPAAALVGDTVITSNDRLLLPASRINGCIIGSAAGCVNTVIGNFVLSLPREVVSPIVADEGAPVPFDPLVGTNNESLFSDAATAPEGEEACRERDAAGVCVGN